MTEILLNDDLLNQVVTAAAQMAIDTYIQEREKVQLNEKFDKTENLLKSYRDLIKKRDTSQVANYIAGHIERMLMIYKTDCLSSNRTELIRRFNVMYYRFIAAEEKSYKELAKNYFVNERTIHKDKHKAIKDLSVYLLGIDGLIDFDLKALPMI